MNARTRSYQALITSDAHCAGAGPERPAPRSPADAWSSPGSRRGWRRGLALCLGPRFVAGLNPRRPFGVALVSAASTIRRVEDRAIVGHDETDAAAIATIAERAMDDHDMLARRECYPAYRRNALQECRRGGTLEDPLLAGAVLDEQQRVRAVIGPTVHRPLNHLFARRIEHGEAVMSLDHRGRGAADRQHRGEYEEPVHRSLCCSIVGELFAERRIETQDFARVLRVAVLARQIRGQVRATARLIGAANVVEALFARKRHLRGAFSGQRGVLVRAALPPSHPKARVFERRGAGERVNAVERLRQSDRIVESSLHDDRVVAVRSRLAVIDLHRFKLI